MIKRLTVAMVAVILAAGVAVCAQEALGEKHDAPDSIADKEGIQEKQEYREKLRRRAETMMIFFVADEIELSAEKEDEFVDMMRGHLKEKSRLDEKEIEFKRGIAEQLKSDQSDPEELEKNLAELEELREKKTESEKDLKKKLKDVLTVEQQAKFEMAVPKAREEIMRMIQKVKNKQGKGPNAPDIKDKPGPKKDAPGPKNAPGPKGAPGPKPKFKK